MQTNYFAKHYMSLERKNLKLKILDILDIKANFRKSLYISTVPVAEIDCSFCIALFTSISLNQSRHT